MENRYLILETYYGKCGYTNVIAATDNIADATMICQAMAMYRQSQGRDWAFDYKAKKIVDGYIDCLDDIDYFDSYECYFKLQEQQFNNKTDCGE